MGLVLEKKAKRIAEKKMFRLERVSSHVSKVRIGSIVA